MFDPEEEVPGGISGETSQPPPPPPPTTPKEPPKQVYPPGHEIC